jgi:TRAP-type mannitol/chloroaromatic compound transport system substrate-binding protein
MTTRRKFLTSGALAGAATIAAPATLHAQTAIKWRFQTYAGATLGQFTTKPVIDAINAAAKGELEIELFYADQLVPTGELFQALQSGTIDAVHSDEPVLFEQYGLRQIWEEAYKEAGGVVWLSAAGQDPCNFNTKKPIRSVADLSGLKVYTFPTAGRFLAQFGVIPVTIPYEDAEVAVQTGEMDGMAWSGITEDYTVGWADVTDYITTNNISGAWIGSMYVNEEKWAELPDHLKSVVRNAIEAGHHYRNQWYWGGEAKLRATGTKLELTSIPAAEWREVENAALVFWDEIAQQSERSAKVVQIFKDYNAITAKSGTPYTCL